MKHRYLHQVHEYISGCPDLKRLPPTKLEIREQTKHFSTVGLYFGRRRTIQLWLGTCVTDQIVTIAHELAHHLADYRRPTRNDHDDNWHQAFIDIVEWMVPASELVTPRNGWVIGKSRRTIRSAYEDARRHKILNNGSFGHGIIDHLVYNRLWFARWDIPEEMRYRQAA